jgi:hypothetical protein
MKPRRTILPLALALTFALASARADDACKDSDSIETCYLRHQTPSESATGAVVTDAKKALAGKTTGADSFASHLASSINDFNHLFRGLIQSTNESDDGKSLTVDFNLKPLAGDVSAWQLQAVAREPEVYKALELALPEATREARSAELKNELSDLDDLTAVVSWSPQNARIGRSFSGNADLFSQMIVELDRLANENVKVIPADLLLSLSHLLKDEASFTDETMLFAAIPDPALRKSARDLVENFSVAQSRADAEFRALAKSRNLIAFADLINNQPQVYVSGSYRWRDPIGGPDEISVKATYEHGFANVNALRRACGCKDAATLLGRLAAYAAGTREQSVLKHSDRLAVTVQYDQSGAYHISLPSDGVTLDLDSSHKLTASLAYGRYVSFDALGNEVGRLDAKAELEDFGNDPTRQRRAVASMVYTQKLSDDWSIPIGVTWANREEFVGDVQKNFSAHLGLSYKLPWKK